MATLAYRDISRTNFKTVSSISTNHIHHLILYTPFKAKIHRFSKRFLQSTIDVLSANTFPLHNQPPYLDSLPLFFGFIFSFPISFGNNKARWRFLFDLCKLSQSTGLVSTFLPLHTPVRVTAAKLITETRDKEQMTYDPSDDCLIM